MKDTVSPLPLQCSSDIPPLSVAILPTIIFYLDGEEAGRLQGNMQFKLETTTKELDKKVEEIYNEDKFN